MTSEPLAARARRAGVAWRVAPGAWGWADLAAVRVLGADAARFLHSQTTNDVEGLPVGGGHTGARVTRTGHLVAVFTLHRLPDDAAGPAFLLLIPREDRDRLLADLDAFLFADDVRFVPVDAPVALVQGPEADAVAVALTGRALDEGAVAEVGGGLVVAASVTGDPGIVVVGPADEALALAAARGFEVADAADVAEAVDALRIEAGLVRPAVDLPKRRLLPETGLEQHAVSYTKGCYLGQEVIARVRTYGTVPNALRALVFEPGAELPAVGDELVTEGGARIGQAASSVSSPVLGAPVALAYLGRDHRTPGVVHTLRLATGLRRARVALLPIHRAADQASRVRGLYDRAIETFAAGDADGALAALERAIRLDPSFADAYEAIGVMLGRAGRFHEAIDFFHRLAEVVPEEPMVDTNLSLYYMRLGDKATAEEHSARAAAKAMARGSGAGRTAAQIAAEADQARRADAARKERMFRQVLDFDPEDPVALFGLGVALVTLDRPDEAVAALVDAARVDAKNSAIYPVLGLAYEHLGRDDDARDAYRRGVEVASRRGDLMPLKEMQARLLLLGGASPDPRSA